MAQAKEALWGVDDVVEYLGIPKSSIYRMTAAKIIPHFKIGGRTRFRQGDLDRWLLDQEAGPDRRPLPGRTTRKVR